MILYFSATGNSKYVAARLAQAVGQEIISIVDCIKDNSYRFEDDMIGIVSPTYYWGLPGIVKDFLEKASFKTDYLYFVATYGTTPGAVGYMADKAIQGCSINACYSVRMADTWTPIFDLSTPEKIAKYMKKTETEIDKVIQNVNRRCTNKYISQRVLAFATELFAQPLYYKQACLTSHFHVENSCTGCGLCAKKCPIQAIEIQGGRPVWVKEKCVTCLGCLHRCPQFAIQYGRHTKNHGQYTNPNVKL